jgi:glucose/arabinose dehydrogenase
MKRLILLLTLAITSATYAQQRGGNILGDGPWNFNTYERNTRIRVSVVTKGLSHPWSMSWLPNGDMLVTERAGRLRIIRNGVLDPEPIAGVPKVQAGGTSGLLDVAIHPKFETNGFVYLVYNLSKPAPPGTAPQPGGRGGTPSVYTTGLSRGRFDGKALVDVKEIFVA